MSLVRRSMFDPFADFWDPFDGVFRSLVPSVASSDRDTAAFANARIDWKETPEAHVFKADLPGVKKEEVKVEVEDGNVLVISGERSKEEEDKNDKWHRVERSSGKFMRRFRLPENAKVDHVNAGLENGVLTVTVPKAEIKKPECAHAHGLSLVAKLGDTCWRGVTTLHCYGCPGGGRNTRSDGAKNVGDGQWGSQDWVSGDAVLVLQSNNALVRRSSVFDPFADFLDPFDVFCSVAPAAASSERDAAVFANARIDWKETPEAHVIKADIPGVKKEEVKVVVEDGNVLVISGERSKEKEDKNDKWHRIERSSGKFMRRFRLPENAKVDQVKAGLENGVLTITVPKAEVKKPEVKSIQISG
ncbi:hypothetical protein PR202_gb26531 [Eleusine coracana subsp. coracana]|uniref:SHSP domain-containing protein n=1 Tax=Eleusine coracana subsp. coracana TaxID=191504 RepID=A0AAV5FSW7_ELECO|nr:hypothetical protein PR202_gb26531 [Eleusine coracana subsp. coracana]